MDEYWFEGGDVDLCFEAVRGGGGVQIFTFSGCEIDEHWCGAFFQSYRDLPVEIGGIRVRKHKEFAILEFEFGKQNIRIFVRERKAGLWVNISKNGGF